jgi:hypothetical protein
MLQQGDPGHLTRLAHIPTAACARTALFVPDQNRLYLAVPRVRGTVLIGSGCVFDRTLCARHNARMQLSRQGRSLTCGLLSVAVAGLLLLPPEHLHAGGASSTHHWTVVHRHFAAHQTASQHSTLDHPDGEPHWLPSALGAPVKGRHLDPLKTVLGIHVALASPPPQIAADRFLVEQPPAHGPPRTAPSGLRAPPSSSL